MSTIRTSGARRAPFAFIARAAAAAIAFGAALVALPAAADDAPRVRLTTTLGDIVVEIDERRAPASARNFLAYVDDGFYEGTLFHRVIEGFMIQGGGFTERFERKPTRAPIPNEANNGLPNRRYTIAMARTNAPHSATSQFFVNTADNPNLDHSGSTPRGWGYAVFGEVVSGHDVVDRIATVPTGPGGPFSRDAPREPVVILGARRVDGGAPDEPPATGGEPAVTGGEPDPDTASGPERTADGAEAL